MNLHSSLASNSTAGRRAHAVGPNASSASGLELPRFLPWMGHGHLQLSEFQPKGLSGRGIPRARWLLSEWDPELEAGVGPQGTSPRQLSCPMGCQSARSLLPPPEPGVSPTRPISLTVATS